jgi:vacuolar protein sorting-associated protein 13A/C
VYIDGILLQLIPIDVKNISKQEIQQKLTRHKRNKLDALDRKIQEDEKLKDNKQPKETNNKTSYTQKLTEKILDNLEVIISNVHIRYEDSSSSPGVTFSAGCILNQFSISTTDWDWNRIFISRDSNVRIILNHKQQHFFFNIQK